VGGFKSGKRAAFGFLSAAAVRRGGAAALVSPAGGRAVQAGGMPARPPVPVVAAVIVDTAGRVLLARRPAHKHLGLKWEFPGGKIEAGEAPESALARELREELGIAVEITRALPRFTHDYEAVTIEMVTFVCRLAPGSEPPVAHEHEALAWCAVDALREYDLAPADLPIVAMLAAPLPLPAVSRLPAPGDNVAIAIRRIEAGEVLELAGGPRPLPHTVLEGHRFAVAPIAAGAALLSWGLPFGRALRPIAAGDYVSNAAMLTALAMRELQGARLPEAANFEDVLEPFRLDEAAVEAAPPGPRGGAAADVCRLPASGRAGAWARAT
jgi:8-oxo-dGTP diphosphatase